MNRDRVAARTKAWREGAWVREAALAFAEKQNRSAENKNDLKQAAAS